MKKQSHAGRCRLCNTYGPLVSGHVFPAFIYRRFVADQRKGGRFINLLNKSVATRPLRYFWFCARCDNEVLGGLERNATPFFDDCMAQPDSTRAYNEQFHRFVVSFAWRAGMMNMQESNTPGTRDLLRAPLRTWKNYLLGYGSDIRPFSMHAFLVIGGTWDVHKAAGAEIVGGAGFLFAQLGPLFLLGLLDRSSLKRREIAVWEKSELRPEGGIIAPVSEWRVNEEIPHSVFDQFRLHETRSINAAKQM